MAINIFKKSADRNPFNPQVFCYYTYKCTYTCQTSFTAVFKKVWNKFLLWSIKKCPMWDCGLVMWWSLSAKLNFFPLLVPVPPLSASALTFIHVSNSGLSLYTALTALCSTPQLLALVPPHFVPHLCINAPVLCMYCSSMLQ